MRKLLLLIGIASILAACSGGSATDSTNGITDPPAASRDSAGNLLAGPGWELIKFTRSGPTYSVAVAESAADTVRMWASLRLDVPAPGLDYETHVLMLLGHAVSGSCPEVQFQGLTIEPSRVYGNFTFIHDREACTADANPAAYLLAVERAALPERFVLSLEAEDVCAGCDEDVIAVDLTSDEPDESQWWAVGRFGIVVGGAPPEVSHVFVLRYGGTAEPLAILAADWQVEQRWIQGGERIPDRIEAFTANCIGGEGCIEDMDSLEPMGPVCGTNIEATPQRDLAALITFADDGSCEIELVAGTDGTEFRPDDSAGDT